MYVEMAVQDGRLSGLRQRMKARDCSLPACCQVWVQLGIPPTTAPMQKVPATFWAGKLEEFKALPTSS